MATTSNLSLLLSISLISFLLLLSKVNSAETFNFDFKKFKPDQEDLLLQGDTVITSTGRLQLTQVKDGKPVDSSVGRALYSAPIHIWDSNTGNVANFYTSFKFVINAPDKAKTADGLAFFLAPVDTQPQKPGGLLGIFPNDGHSKSNHIVAVEFDTFDNDWDPRGRHVGIDVNSIRSRKTTSWDFENGEVAEAVINYHAASKSLNANLFYRKYALHFTVSDVVDLKEVLPEYVRIGFSASTGLTKHHVETHDVLSWYFDSYLPDSRDDDENKPHLSSYVLRRGPI